MDVVAVVLVPCRKIVPVPVTPALGIPVQIHVEVLVLERCSLIAHAPLILVLGVLAKLPIVALFATGQWIAHCVLPIVRVRAKHALAAVVQMGAVVLVQDPRIVLV
jgi:hypothetical protein